MIIYKTTNMVNGKIYVGQTKKPLTSNYLGSGVLMSKAIRKYGKENFIRETLCECSTQDELDRMEKHWIEKLNSRDILIGYNIAYGGMGGTYGPLPEEQKVKIRNTMIERGISVGSKNPFYGKRHPQEIMDIIIKKKTGVKLTDEHRKKISESQIGVPKSHKGRPLTEDHIQKLKDGQARRKSSGLKRRSPPSFSEEHRKNLSEATTRQWIKYREGKQ